MTKPTQPQGKQLHSQQGISCDRFWQEAQSDQETQQKTTKSVPFETNIGGKEQKTNNFRIYFTIYQLLVNFLLPGILMVACYSGEA